MDSVAWNGELAFLGVMFAAGALVSGASTLVNGSFRGIAPTVATAILGGAAAVGVVCWMYPDPAPRYSRAPVFVAFAAGTLAKPIVQTLTSRRWRDRIVAAAVRAVSGLSIDPEEKGPEDENDARRE